MHYTKRLQEENNQLKSDLNFAIEKIIEMQSYFLSDKFFGHENDFAHVSTDIYPKITALKTDLQIALNKI